MTQRITKRQLELKVTFINDITDSPRDPWTRNEDGKFQVRSKDSPKSQRS